MKYSATWVTLGWNVELVEEGQKWSLIKASKSKLNGMAGVRMAGDRRMAHTEDVEDVVAYNRMIETRISLLCNGKGGVSSPATIDQHSIHCLLIGCNIFST